MKKKLEEVTNLYELDGQELLGSFLRIQKRSEDAAALSECSIQWYRVSSDSDKKEPISGINC